MQIIWTSLVQAHFDYEALIWAPVGIKQDMEAMEAPLRNFSRRIQGLHNKNYWEQLKNMNIFIYERRLDRFKIFYTWKSIQV